MSTLVLSYDAMGLNFIEFDPPIVFLRENKKKTHGNPIDFQQEERMDQGSLSPLESVGVEADILAKLRQAGAASFPGTNPYFQTPIHNNNNVMQQNNLLNHISSLLQAKLKKVISIGLLSSK